MENPLISLAVIVGNVEEYIERFLEAFKPLADEIIIVRAIGSAKPDRTLEICQQHDCKTFIYENSDECKEWEHVDHFANARNFAFAQATGQWIAWADTDDWIDEQSIKALRRYALMDDVDFFTAPYDIKPNKIIFTRERMMRKGVGKWHGAVHEFWRPDSDTRRGVEITINEFSVQHVPFLNKKGSPERNLRILEHFGKDDDHTAYYLHQEYLGTGQLAKCVQAGKAFLQRTNADPVSKYEVLLNLAQLAQEPKDKETLLFNALSIQPERREAIALLSATSLDCGLYDRALAFARMMTALPIPPKKPWTHRDGVYGWAGAQLFTQCLRMTGQGKRADEIEDKIFQDAGGIITLVHATRGRGQKASMTRKLWIETATVPERVEHIFIFDDDDQESLEMLSRFKHIVVPAGGGCVRAWNEGFARAKGKLLVQLSDDFKPSFGWDTVMLKRVDLSKPQTLGFCDGIEREQTLLTMCAMTRKRYKQKGYFYHPRFKSMYADNWLTYEEQRDGTLIDCTDIVFEHEHPLSELYDKTYAEQNAPERYVEGKKVFDELLAVDTSKKS